MNFKIPTATLVFGFSVLGGCSGIWVYHIVGFVWMTSLLKTCLCAFVICFSKGANLLRVRLIDVNRRPRLSRERQNSEPHGWLRDDSRHRLINTFNKSELIFDHSISS